MTRRIGLDFCCNDPDNGLFSGRLEGIQLYDGGDPVFELEPRRETAPMIARLGPNALRIAGKRWPILGKRDSVGNWCWNRYIFTIEQAVDLLAWIRRRELFVMSCGDSRLYHAWRLTESPDQFGSLATRLLIEATT